VLGMPLHGTATLQARARVPDVPKMNKTKQKGQDAPGMSRAKIATTPEIYKAALDAHGLPAEEYADVISGLRPFDDIYFQYRGPLEIETMLAEMRQHADQLAWMEAHDSFPRSAYPFGCKGCSHRSYCQAELNGEDTDYLAQTEYMQAGENPYAVLEIEDESDSSDGSD